ncbi:MAG: HAMP domain-containing sensor histidine kinase [Elusimicrobiota bacterium]
MVHERAGSILVRYETALWSVLGALAYLARENTHLVYPDILWLFALLLSVSLLAAWAVHLWPRKDWPHAACTVASFAVIAGIQSRSGGPESNLWVLYFLPLFSCALLLRGRELAWVAIGASLCNALMYIGPDLTWSAVAGFELTVKTGVLWAAAGSTWILAESERRVRERSEVQHDMLGRLESDLRQAEKARARDQRLSAVGLASAATAHDLATPLTVIRGYAQLRLEQADLDEDIKHDLQRIDRAASFCQQLASTTLSAARGDERSGVRLNLLESAENALALSEDVLKFRRIKVSRDFADREFYVRGQSNELERIFMNLISNASKAMPDGGTLSVRLSSSRSPEADLVEACVEDSGQGIPPKLLSKMFSPFVTTRADSGGTGLGLYLCREIARRHGGDLSAFNRPGGGAIFSLRLPLERAAAAKSAHAPT